MATTSVAGKLFRAGCNLGPGTRSDDCAGPSPRCHRDQWLVLVFQLAEAAAAAGADEREARRASRYSAGKGTKAVSPYAYF